MGRKEDVVEVVEGIPEVIHIWILILFLSFLILILILS